MFVNFLIKITITKNSWLFFFLYIASNKILFVVEKIIYFDHPFRKKILRLKSRTVYRRCWQLTTELSARVIGYSWTNTKVFDLLTSSVTTTSRCFIEINWICANIKYNYTYNLKLKIIRFILIWFIHTIRVKP